MSITWFTSEKEAGHSYFIASDCASHSPSTSNQAILGSNHTKSVNTDNHSTSEILPAKAAAIEVETEPTSEHHNSALTLLIPSFPTQGRGKDPVYFMSAEPKVVCFAKVGGTLFVANYNAVATRFFVFFFMNFVLNCHKSHVRMNIAFSI